MASRSIEPFLMFEGQASAALEFYLSVFPGGRIEDITRYGPGEPGPEGTIKHARFTICGQTVRCSDSFVKHGFTFTPSFSFFVECSSEAEVRQLSERLKEGGKEMMPVGNYGFSTLFAWVADRFGISWQLNCA
ncbi:VOC family protein [Siccirubricoccus phaeus]|uniref:VOC family protein n=1 Tax=Siccirubricoccus phaeus TaxID=2595053 RepID=UPI0011F17829|nr:VOC family protein [Siccirubricoccus phaeus]